ncbi:MAG: PDR/VanB family oxidoreductase [Xanthobacteraceae bacterium]|jgi:ferredoxin-NADP reductase
MNTTSSTSAPSGTAAHGLIDARLTKIEDVARDTKIFTFQRVDGGKLPGYKPGAHIDLHLPNGMLRQFSLTVPVSDPDGYTVGVKRDENSRGGSRYIIEQMKVGDLIKISAPRNNFPLVENADHVVLVAGGIGITPIWCMAQELEAQSRSWKIHYACRSQADMAFLSDLKKLDPERVHLHFDDEAGGKVLDLTAAIAEAPANAHFYCCGPNPMLKAFEAAAASRPRANVHIEYFTAKEEASANELGGFWVELTRSGEEYFIPPGKKVLEVLFDAGVDVDYSCELGICGACETRVISGTPIHHDSVLSEEEQASNEKVMICCCGCATERLVLDM